MTHDLITVGRVSLDLFAREIGAEFHDIRSFETSVGGSPVNIAIGTSRLGLRAIAFTAVGDDEVGRFVRRYLARQGVNTDYIAIKPERRTGMAVVGVQPPDQFPLVFYRENPADIHLSISEAQALPIDKTRALSLSGTALSRGDTRDVGMYLAEAARHRGLTTFIDLDLRPDQWAHPLAYGLNLRPVLPFCDALIGTEEEFYAALSPTPEPVMAGEALRDRPGLEALLQRHCAESDAVLIVKRGDRGVTLLQGDGQVDVPGYPVKVLNTVGAGDGFASGLIFGWAQGWGWERAARFANACGALVVTRQGCARALPRREEVEHFISDWEGAGT
ncbi:MAG: 5-dehydro-2-deoxygluconokinase [Chloroflexi bacterium]|nr:5-dehydro-2-deoxygluconokinase [Chloroflexota bacterium]